MAKPTRVGIIGTGNISSAYFKLARLFKDIEIVAGADQNIEAAKAKASEFGFKPMSVKDLLADPSIEIAVNLTVPAAHFAVTRQCLQAGKHVYSEKPVVLSMKEGLALKALADKKSLKIASAPDTFMGASHQAARHLIDAGRIGKVLSGTCAVMGFGMEHWHPNPDFFFKPGGGPMLDMGPYYLHNLINLVGPVKRVAALSGIGWPLRTISSQPRAGQTIKVETPTTFFALLECVSGAQITLSASWDVWAHRHANMELYGSEGSLYVPDPNFFGGELLMTKRDAAPEPIDFSDNPLGVINDNHGPGREFANYRTVGLADMAVAIREGRDMRCSYDRALHAIEIMTGIMKSGETGKFVAMKTTCTRPAALSAKDARQLFR
jgi:predicted dehydrogenase